MRNISKKVPRSPVTFKPSTVNALSISMKNTTIKFDCSDDLCAHTKMLIEYAANARYSG